VSTEPGSDRRNGPARRRWRALRAFATAVLLLVGLAVVGAIGMRSLGVVSRVEEFMAVARPWLYTAQLSCTAILWLRWRWMVGWLARHKRISPWAVEPLMQARHRVVALVLFIQLTVVMGLPFSLLDVGVGH
jgi:hypothetical protein